jgi:oxygen-independent coproporphyrinogen-3 oxidase
VSVAPRAGLYVHVPFCARVCPYCDFAVRTGGPERHRSWLTHLLAEIELWHPVALRFDTIYFGGGTPSALDPALLRLALDGIAARFDLDPARRVFVEANPEDVTLPWVEAVARLGVATLSLGVQSMDAATLRLLGRAHDPADARRAVASARAAGFETVSLDLIYGVPGQEAADLEREIEQVLDLAPDHVSAYQLTVHEGTRFGSALRRGRLVELPPDRQGELFRLVHRRFAAAGFEGYEVSQFARSAEHRSRHNLKYWRHEPYLGLGPSAHSFDGRRRWWNERRTSAWEARIDAGERPVAGVETLAGGALALEALMVGLRTRDGVDLARVREVWGIDLFTANRTLLDELERTGLVRRHGMRLVPSLDGMAVADGLAALFEISEVQATVAPGSDSPAPHDHIAIDGVDRQLRPSLAAPEQIAVVRSEAGEVGR